MGTIMKLSPSASASAFRCTSGTLAALTVALLAGGCVSAGTHGGAGGSPGGQRGAGGQAGAAPGGHGAGGTSGGGGAILDAGSAGGASGDASNGAGGAVGNPCSTRAGLLFCDDFEAWPTGSAPAGTRWSTAPGSPITVDSSSASAPAHSGSRSVHFAPTSNSFQTFLVFHDPATLPVSGGKFFVRFFIRLASGMTGGHNTFMTADTFASAGAGNAVRVGEQQHMLMMTVAGDSHAYLSNQNFYNDGKPGVVFAAGAWTCFEMSFDPASTTLDVWVNGTEVPDMHPTNITLDTYDALRFGLEKYAGLDADAGASATLDLWYDDVAIGTQRIGCQ
jgi:hypothetical protein